MDLHDGADGRPVVKHGFTFIKDAYLGEILIQIKEFAFCASPYVHFFLRFLFTPSLSLRRFSYPLFLNLENHCSNKQQILVAKLLVDVFGGKIRLSNCFTTDREKSSSIDLHSRRDKYMFSLAITGTIKRSNSYSSTTYI